MTRSTPEQLKEALKAADMVFMAPLHFELKILAAECRALQADNETLKIAANHQIEISGVGQHLKERAERAEAEVERLKSEVGYYDTKGVIDNLDTMNAAQREELTSNKKMILNCEAAIRAKDKEIAAKDVRIKELEAEAHKMARDGKYFHHEVYHEAVEKKDWSMACDFCHEKDAQISVAKAALDTIANGNVPSGFLHGFLLSAFKGRAGA